MRQDNFGKLLSILIPWRRANVMDVRFGFQGISTV